MGPLLLSFACISSFGPHGCFRGGGGGLGVGGGLYSDASGRGWEVEAGTNNSTGAQDADASWVPSYGSIQQTVNNSS